MLIEPMQTCNHVSFNWGHCNMALLPNDLADVRWYFGVKLHVNMLVTLLVSEDKPLQEVISHLIVKKHATHAYG